MFRIFLGVVMFAGFLNAEPGLYYLKISSAGTQISKPVVVTD